MVLEDAGANSDKYDFGLINDKNTIHLPRQVRCEIWQNAMKWGFSWHNVAREMGITTGWTTKL